MKLHAFAATFQDSAQEYSNEVNTMPDTTRSGFRRRCAALAENPIFQRTIIVLIIVNAITLGLETSKDAMERAGTIISILDNVILSIFVIELTIRIVAYGRDFFRDPWSIFDFIVVDLFDLSVIHILYLIIVDLFDFIVIHFIDFIISLSKGTCGQYG